MQTTIYVPDELHRQIKKAGINVSRICQEALREALGLVVFQGGQELEEWQIMARDLDEARKTLVRVANWIEKESGG